MLVGVSLPREVIPGQFYMITCRCQQRQFLLRPHEATNNAFAYPNEIRTNRGLRSNHGQDYPDSPGRFDPWYRGQFIRQDL